jgi:RIO-like serine/threonine protein kinase
VKDKYGLVPIGVLQGMSRIDTSKTEEGIKEFLNSKLVDRLEKDEDYIDIVILCVKAEGEDKILEGVPPVRLCFKN